MIDIVLSYIYDLMYVMYIVIYMIHIYEYILNKLYDIYISDICIYNMYCTMYTYMYYVYTIVTPIYKALCSLRI